MISFDTNLLLYSLNKDCPEHTRARAFFDSLPVAPGEVVICELVLIELYVLLRNPAVLKQPLDAADAVALVHTFRQHPTWRLIDYPGASSTVMDEVWRLAAQPNVGRRVVFDARLALTLRHHGVVEFATRNDSRFASFGFTRVFNPVWRRGRAEFQISDFRWRELNGGEMARGITTAITLRRSGGYQRESVSRDRSRRRAPAS